MQKNKIVRVSVLVTAGAAVLGLGGGVAAAAHADDGVSRVQVESNRQQAGPQMDPDRQQEVRRQAELDRQQEVRRQAELDRQQPRRLAAPDPGPAPVPAPAPGPAPAPAPAPGPAPAPAPAPPNDLA
jgi:hypothetical protein